MSVSETITLDVPTVVTAALCADVPWHTKTVATLDEVECVLARAERDGFREHELTVLAPSVLVVRWR